MGTLKLHSYTYHSIHIQLSADDESLLSLSSLSLHEVVTQGGISKEDVQTGKHTNINV